MKVLAATNQTQRWRDNDFAWTVEGELVFFPPLECGRGSVDDDCGCRRSMAGMVSHRATTTVKVVERQDMDPDAYAFLLIDCLESQGYLTSGLMSSPEVRDWVRDQADELMHMAAAFPVGTVLERREDLMSVRETPT